MPKLLLSSHKLIIAFIFIALCSSTIGYFSIYKSEQALRSIIENKTVTYTTKTIIREEHVFLIEDQDIENTIGPIARLKQSISIMTATFILLIILFGIMIAYRIKPLRNAILHIAQGEKNITIPVLKGNDSIAQLSQSIHVMQKHWMEQNQHLQKDMEEYAGDLEKNENQYQTLTNHAPFCIYEINREGNFTKMNTVGLSMMGVADEKEIVNLPYLDIIAPEERKRVNAAMQKAFNGEKVHIECTAILNNTTRAIASSLIPLMGKDGSVIKLLGYTMDCTEQKEAEEKLQNLSLATEQSPSIIMITDDRGIIEYVNPKFTEVTQYTSEEVVGSDARTLSTQTPSQRENMWNTLYDGNEWKGEMLRTKKDGEEYWEHVLISNIKNQNNDITHFVCVSENITERKTMEEKLRKSLREKEILLQEIHHRVKNNMQIISSILRLQKANSDSREHDHLFQNIQNRILTMSLVHNQLYQSPDFSHVNMKKYITAILNNLFQSYSIHADNVDKTIKIESLHLPMDKVIPCGLIVNELVSNALEHAFPRKRNKRNTMSVSLHKDKEYAVLSVTDNGIGLPSDEQKENSSLGLELVQILSEEQLNGTLNVEREHGSAFTIRFPLT